MTRDRYIKLHENLIQVLGDINAAKLCYDYFIIAQYWDDLIDRDNELSDIEIHDAFYTSLITIPTNPFYLKNSHKILPILEITIYKWFQANKYEKEKKELHKAYMLRAGLYDIFSACYIAIHGIGADFNIYDLYGETFNEFIKEFE